MRILSYLNANGARKKLEGWTKKRKWIVLFYFTGRIGRTVFPFASFKTSARPR